MLERITFLADFVETGSCAFFLFTSSVAGITEPAHLT